MVLMLVPTNPGTKLSLFFSNFNSLVKSLKSLYEKKNLVFFMYCELTHNVYVKATG